jgi:hypothetical protein
LRTCAEKQQSQRFNGALARTACGYDGGQIDQASIAQTVD